MADISNKEDLIDSRDIIARIGDLEDIETPDADEAEELRVLKALSDEAAQYAADWEYGETLIRDSYFEDYARELAEDIGSLDRNAAWPMNHIDWEAAADQLKGDYTSVDYDGVTYWVR